MRSKKRLHCFPQDTAQIYHMFAQLLLCGNPLLFIGSKDGRLICYNFMLECREIVTTKRGERLTPPWAGKEFSKDKLLFYYGHTCTQICMRLYKLYGWTWPLFRGTSPVCANHYLNHLPKGVVKVMGVRPLGGTNARQIFNQIKPKQRTEYNTRGRVRDELGTT